MECITSIEINREGYWQIPRWFVRGVMFLLIAGVTIYMIWYIPYNRTMYFPVQLNQIEKFMNQNAPIAVNVYYFDSETECVKPIFLASKPIESRYVHLLLLTETVTSNEETLEVGIHSHYCWIKNFSALVHTQITKNTRKLFVCDRCLNYFSSQIIKMD